MTRAIFYSFLGLILLAILLPSLGPALSGGIRGKYLRQQKQYAKLFKAGDTNVPLFAMDWFGPTVHFCRVNQAGKGSARRDVGHAIQAGVSISLNETNLQALVETINQLPPPPRRSLPVERQIVVGCIRSNQWFRAVYDRADIPKELERVTEITAADLPWYIPIVQGHSIVSEGGNFVCVATEAPIAISKSDLQDNIHPIHSILHVWELDRWGNKAVSESSIIPEWATYWNSTAISPGGNLVAVAGSSGLYVADWKAGKLLWQAGPLDQDGYCGKIITIGGGGRYLFTAGAHVVECWDLNTGEKLSELAQNQDIVKILKTSRNGNVLIAGLGGNVGNMRPSRFIIWEAGKDKSALNFEEAEGAMADLSPDGEWIALSRFGQEHLVLFKWRTGERKEVYLRNSQGAYSVYWSPDGKRLAAYVDSYPASILIYDTTTWKPIARWNCGRIGESSEFIFGKDGTLYQIIGNEINALDVISLKHLADD